MAIRILLSSAFFEAYYFAAAVLCGVFVRWVDGRRAGVHSSHGADERAARRRLAIFLAGSGLAPFAIGVANGLFWWLLPGTPGWAYPTIQWIIVVSALLLARRQVRQSWADLRGYLSAWPAGKRAAAFLVAIILAAAVFAVLGACQPITGYDAATYALDARRVASERSVGALMTFTPDHNDNQFANHNHGCTFQWFLASALIYSDDPVQDFPVRLAIMTLALHVLVCIVGLGLCVSGLTAVLALAAFGSYRAFGWMMAAYSRDLYRLLPLLVIFALASDRRSWPGFNLRGVVAAVAMTYFWNAHATALVVAPFLIVCLLAFSPSLRSALGMATAFVVSIPLGAWGLIRATVETGSPTGYSPFYNANYEGTAVVEHWWQARGADPVGWLHAPHKLAAQFMQDGYPLVVLLWAALLVFAAWMVVKLIRRRAVAAPPTAVMLIGLFLLVMELLLAGLLDPIDGRISTALAMNFRYRAHFYPLGVVLIGYIIAVAVYHIRMQSHEVGAAAVCVALTLAAGLTVGAELGSHAFPAGTFIDAYEGRKRLASRPETRWIGHLAKVPAGELILMDYAYLGWYHTDGRIMFTQDPRVRPAFTAQRPEEALKVLDDLGVQYLYLIDLEATAILNSGIALAKVIESDAFELLDSEPNRWQLYRRLQRLGGAAPPSASNPARQPVTTE